ncbi:hypothetical protein G7Z17_g12305 [Cylindrodendrum hubeiense]|uniref:Uncharacterized protein n=1 Tax=Cylindrodendrum hubeiense TaxID=595255 RepID=A0A9P5GUB7_9HYPO|nr:hypothetical protein G7Z17_g12305 [Cylindrodendrum hubeiense]
MQHRSSSQQGVIASGRWTDGGSNGIVERSGFGQVSGQAFGQGLEEERDREAKGKRLQERRRRNNEDMSPPSSSVTRSLSSRRLQRAKGKGVQGRVPPSAGMYRDTPSSSGMG